MRKPAATIVRIGCAALVLATLPIEPAAGYTLVDWIRGWPRATPGAVAAPLGSGTSPFCQWFNPAPAPVYAAPAPVYAAPAPSCSAPPVVAPPPACDSRPSYYTAPAAVAPAPNCGAAVAPAPAAAGVAYVQPVAIAPAPVPQVAYRTTWVRVPTTNYRPVVTYDPATGWPATAMQPCTTYTWQVQRVPADGPGRKFLDSLRDMFRPAPPVPAQVVGIYAPTAAGAPAAAGAPPGSALAEPAQAMPAYAAPPGLNAQPSPGPTVPLSPPTPSPGWAPSAAPSQPPAIAPAAPTAPVQAAPGGASGGTQPADIAPRLSPNETQGLQPIPENRGYPPSGYGATPAAPPLLGPTQSAQPTPPTAPLSPVPDPDARKTRTQVPAAPSLYDPDSRTARLLPLNVRWPAAPIQWSPQPAVTEAATPVDAHLPTITRDADGWQSVRP